MYVNRQIDTMHPSSLITSANFTLRSSIKSNKIVRGNSAKDFENVVLSFKEKKKKKASGVKGMNFHLVPLTTLKKKKKTKNSYKALGHPLLPAVSQIAFPKTDVKYFCRTADSEK